MDWHLEAGDLPLRAERLPRPRRQGSRQCTEYGLGRGSGVEVRRAAFQLWDMRDGKAIRCEVFDRKTDALEAAGLRE